MNKGGTKTNKLRIRTLMTMQKALYPRDDIDYMCQEKKGEEDWPALKMAQLYQYEDLRTTLKEERKTNHRSR